MEMPLLRQGLELTKITEVNMAWDYRVLVKRDASGDKHYGIHEVYYDKHKCPIACTDTPCDPYGESVEELKENVMEMMAALLEPVMEYENFGYYQ